MKRLEEIHSLTDFQRNARAHIERLKRTGQPAVLTVNGRAEVVVQDAKSYQELLDLIDQAEAVAGIKNGLDSMNRGAGEPVANALERLRGEHAIPLEE